MFVSRYKKSNKSRRIDENSNALIPSYTPVLLGPQTKYGNNRWEVYSPKLGRNVTLYSDLEYDHWVLVEVDPEIVAFCEQPLKIEIKLPFGKVTTIFDMWLLWNSGVEEFREVKYANDLERYTPTSRVYRQIEAQKRWCELTNKEHKVVTDEEIRKNQIYISNWKLILHHLGTSRYLDTSLLSNKISLFLEEKGKTTLFEIESAFYDFEPTTIKSAVFKMVYSKKINAFLDTQPLTMKTDLVKFDVEKEHSV